MAGGAGDAGGDGDALHGDRKDDAQERNRGEYLDEGEAAAGMRKTSGHVDDLASPGARFAGGENSVKLGGRFAGDFGRAILFVGESDVARLDAAGRIELDVHAVL